MNCNCDHAVDEVLTFHPSDETSDGYARPEVVPKVEDAVKGLVSDRVATVAFPRVSVNAIDDPIVDVK